MLSRLKSLLMPAFVLCASGPVAHDSQDEKKPLTKLGELERFHKPVTGMAAEARLKGYDRRLEMERASPFRNIVFRSVGPEIQGGRIVDIVVPEGNPAGLLIAFATGGLWRTENMGTTWAPLFDRESAITIGDIAAFGKDAETIWVGTGEANSSRTSYAGTGMFKSNDGGKTWQHMGLGETHHIGRILIHPKNPNIVYVAAIGHLYSWNRERGVFKTTDGGKTWRHVLYINERAGVIDLLMDPRDPDVLYAAAWERDRRAWNFLESGAGSGLFKTTNGGATWKKLSGGLPEGEYVGRMGMAICAGKPDVLYVVMDNQAIRPESGKDDERVPSGELSVRRLKLLTDEQFIQLDKKALGRFMRSRFPESLTADALIEMVKKKELTVAEILKHLVDAGEELIGGEVIGAQVFRSDDAGKSWKLTHEERLDGVFSSYGYYFGQVSVSPSDPNRVFILGVPILLSEDGGKTFANVGGPGVHVDHHAIWIDPRWPNRVALGNDGGLNLSWDGGKTWQKINNLPVGQFTTIAVDMARPYRIYGGLQDNGTMRGPNNYEVGRNRPWDWQTIGGGDGASVQVDPRDNETVYISWQFGSAQRRNLVTGESWMVRPLAELKEERLRYNWVSPLLISPHHGDIVYFGANRLYRSMDQGKSWTPLSAEMASSPQLGDVPFGTITAVAESPKRFGLIYIGTDQGKVWKTHDGGVTWTDVSAGLATERWVTRVVASQHEEGVVYASQNGYRQDDFAPYVWKSTDTGSTWTNIAGGLPAEPINVIREDPKTKGLLYVGTDLGVFVSFDAGATWEAMAGELPHVPVHDLVIHPRDSDIVLGTHGRSVYVAPVSLLQGLTQEIRSKEIHVYPIEPMTVGRNWGYERRAPWDKTPVTEPTVRVAFWLKSPAPVKLVLKDKDGKAIKEQFYRKEKEEHKPADFGFNFAQLSLVLEPAKPTPREGKDWKPKTLEEILSDPFADFRARFLTPGEYTVEVVSGSNTASTKFVLKPAE